MDAPSVQTLEHEAFLYGSVDEFVGSMAPFLRAGAAGGDRMFCATHGRNVEALREELGDDAGLVRFEDTVEWCTRPYDRLQAFRRMVGELEPGERLRAMGEPVWAGSAAELRQWARYESIINLALADAPMRFICLYDASGLPDDILAHASHTHPRTVEQDGTVPSGGYVDPQAFRAGPPPSPPAESAALPVEGSELRATLAKVAREAGLEAVRVDELLIAATEVVTNARRHADPPVHVHAWVEDGELVVQVTDGGPGGIGALAGWVPPRDIGTGGWGLAIARQLCDAIDIAPGEDGTTVTLHVGL